MTAARQFVATGLFLASLGVGTARAEDAYAFQRVYKAGDADRYRATFVVRGEGPGGAPLKLQIVLVARQRVTEAKRDGSAVVATTIEEATADAGGTPSPLRGVAGQKMTVTFDAAGSVTKRDAGPALRDVAQLLEMARGEFVPDRPLRVGEEWKYALASREARGEKMNGVLTVLGVDKPGEGLPVETVRVRNVADLTGSAGGQSAHVESTANVEPATGKALRVEGAITGIRAGAARNASITFLRVRLPDAPAAPAR